MDAGRLEPLVERTLLGDPVAGKELLAELWPEWLRIVRASRLMRSFAHTEDHLHNVVAKCVERLAADDWARLRLYPVWRRRANKGIDDWLRIVTANVIRDYVREQTGALDLSARENEPGMPSVKRLLNEFTVALPTDELGARAPITALQTARQLLEFATRHLPALQVAALRLWIEGASFKEIEAELDTDESAEKLVRAALATMRRHFGPSAAR